MKVAIGCDPNAAGLKAELVEELQDGGHEVADFGSDDPIYANVAFKVAEAVSGEPLVDLVVVAGAALEGDVLLVAARDQGTQAWDISDPTKPVELGHTGSVISSAGVVSDGFGHVITLEGKVNQQVSLRLWLLKDLMVEGRITDLMAHQELSAPLTTVGPGDLEIEVSSNQIDFNAEEPPEGKITVTLNDTEDGWEQLTVSEDSVRPYHPVILHDGITGRILWRDEAPPSGDLFIPHDKLDLADGESLPLAYPLRLRAHKETLVWAHASAGPVALAAITIDDSRENKYEFALLSVGQNKDLLEWLIEGESPKKDPCRELLAADSVYPGRIAVARPLEGEATLYAASRYEGVWGIRKSGAKLGPEWITCVRSSGGSELAGITIKNHLYYPFNSRQRGSELMSGNRYKL